MSKHFAGKKFSPSHTTVIDEATETAKLASRLSEVTKVTLGIIKNIKNGKRNIAFTKIPAGLLVKVRGNSSIQQLFIFTSDSAKTQDKLYRGFWSKK